MDKTIDEETADTLGKLISQLEKEVQEFSSPSPEDNEKKVQYTTNTHRSTQILCILHTHTHTRF